MSDPGVRWYVLIDSWAPPVEAVEVDGKRYTANEIVAALRELDRLRTADEDVKVCAQCGAVLVWEDCEGCNGERVYDAGALYPLECEPGEMLPCECCDGQGGGWYCPNVPHTAS